MRSLVFKGNYDQFMKTRLELLENQLKRYNWEQDQMAHMKVTIQSRKRFGLYQIFAKIGF